MGVSAAQGSAGLKPGVCTSTTRPSNPFEGQMIYETDTDLTYIYGGSAWQQVSGGTAVGNSGLVYVTTTSLSGSSTTISNCFSSIYDNYLIVINNLVTGANSLNVLQFATGSTDSSSNYGRVRLYAQATVGSSTSITNSSSGWGYSTSSGASFYKIEVSQPNLARQTFTMSQGNYQDSLYPYIEQQNGLLNTTTQYTGIVFTPIGSTYTSGTATVFGYRKA